MERRVVIFSGRVQGVGFRAAAVRASQHAPVTGWARNEPDGTVRVEVQGEPGAIELALARLRLDKGRLVERETATPAPVVEGERGFSVRH